MIFLQYKETWELLIDYPTIGGEDIKYHVNKAIRNLLHENIDVYIRSLIYGFPVDGVKYLLKLHSNFANMTFAEKSDMIGVSKKSHIKEGFQKWTISRYLKIHRIYQFQWETVILGITWCIFSWITFTKVGNILHILQATRKSWEEKKNLLSKIFIYFISTDWLLKSWK